MKKLILTLTILFTLTNAQALNIKAKAYVLKDINTGKVLLSKNENTYLPPASTTKLMTLYLLFEHLKEGKIKLKDRLTVSKTAWKKGGSKMFLEPGSKIRVLDLIKGIAVSSGNDASTVVAEYISGSEKEFVKLMNKKAKSLGMSRTHFTNATGWDNRGHVSTARDLTTIGERVIKDFPEYYKVFNLRRFKHNGISQKNKNTLLGKLGVDGLKTGHVASVGYNIVSSAKQNQSRYIVTLLGAKSKARRESEVKKLYEYAYNKYKSVKVLDSMQTIAQTQVYLGQNKVIDLGIKKDFFLNLTQAEFKTLKAELEFYPRVNAPVNYGDVLGRIIISYSGAITPTTLELIAKNSSPTITGFRKIQEMTRYKYNPHNYFN